MPILTHNSEYIRLNYNKEQEVTTNLDFQGDLKVKEPTQDLNPATKLYVDNKAQQALNDLKAQAPQVETINKIKWSFNQIGSYGSSNYSGLGCFTFLNQEGYPYQIVAYSFQHPTIITSLTAQIITANPAIVWLAPTDANNIANANWNVNSARQITATPTQEDLDYLAGFQGLIQVKLIIDSYPLISNFNDWVIMPKAFQLKQLKALSGTQSSTGILPTASYSLAFSFWIDDLDSIVNYLNDVKGLNFMMLASSSSSIYATRTLQIEQSFNDKFINYSGIINPFRNNTANPIATLAKSLVTINTTKDEAFNRLKLKDTITDLYLKPTNNIFGFIDWDNTSKTYVFGVE